MNCRLIISKNILKYFNKNNAGLLTLLNYLSPEMNANYEFLIKRGGIP